MPRKSENGGFYQYKNLILSELERFEKKIDSLDRKIDEIKVEVVTLRTKAGMWGALGGGIFAGIITFLASWFSKK